MAVPVCAAVNGSSSDDADLSLMGFCAVLQQGAGASAICPAKHAVADFWRHQLTESCCNFSYWLV